MNGKGYIACGAGLKQLSPNTSQVISLKDVWEYDPSANTWTQVTDYGGNIRHGAVSGVVGNKAIIGSGFAYGEPFDNAYRKDFWIY
jgi:N-acetylneuraminic acid mutarotase